VVGDFADLALKVKDAGIQSVVFDDTVIRPAYPDYDEIRSMVQQALTTTHASEARTEPAPAPGTSTGTSSADPATPTTAAGGASPSPATAAADACAYDPVAAQEALDEGEPPTKNGR
jgi:hypothetical protein